MELAEIRPFEPQMAEIDLFTMPDAVGVGEPSARKVKPYIAGHVTDGSSTFTFTVNGNESVTVPVDANGNWKWVVDRTITSLASAFSGKENLDNVSINDKLDDVTSMVSAFKACVNLELITLCKGTLLNNCTTITEAFRNCPKLVEIVNLGGAELKKCNNITMAFDCYAYQTQATIIDMHSAVFAPLTFASFFARMNKGTYIKMNNARFADNCDCTAMIYSNANLESIELDSASIKGTVTYLFGGCGNLKNLSIGSIGVNLTFNSNSKLTEQSVVNIFNAVSADGITLTFHPTVFAMIEEQLEIEGSPIYEAYWNSDYDFNYASA